MDFQELKENPFRYIRGLAMDIVVVVVGLAYVLYQMVTLETTQLNPLVLIAEAFMGIVCGVVIKQALGENGFSKGYNSQYWQDEEAKYNESCNKAIPYMERVDNYYISEEIEKRRNYRREHLQGARLKYSNWFDFDGNYIGDEETFNKLTRRQKRVIKRCVRVKIYIPNLFSEYETSSEQYTHKEITDKRRKARNMTKNTLTATIIAVIGVYFVPIANWNVASLITSTMQVALWVLFGVLQLYDNYSFVINDKTALLRKKKEGISKFVTGCEKNQYLTNPYDKIVEEQPTNMA